MKVLRSLNVRLFLSYLLVVIVGGLTVFLTARLLAPTIFVDELEGLRLRQGQTESPGGGSGDGRGSGGTGSTLGPGGAGGEGGSGSTRGPSGSDGSGDGGETTPGSGGNGGDGGSGGPAGPGGGGPGGTAGPEDGTGAGFGSGDGPNAAGILLQTEAPTEDEEIEQAFLAALNRALLIGLLVSAVIAVLLALLISGRIMQPIAVIRSAARRLAGGHYDEQVPRPADPELAELADDFNELAATLQESEVRRMQLISEVSHELRTPLTTIQGYMEGLIDGVLEPSDEVYASVADEAARLQRVAADLSLLSRIEEGAMPFEYQTVDVSAVADKVANRLRQQYEDQDVALKTSLEPLMISGDPDRLAQVFTNLIGNALGHTPRGGQVRVASGRTGSVARVTVTDTGHGISPDDLGRVFDRFYRAEQDPHSAGTGIGLTIARSIVRSHGGEVTARSDGLGKGATFVVELPIGR